MNHIFLGIIFALYIAAASAQTTPRLPIGMNVQGLSYWDFSPYLDPMKGSGPWMTFVQGGGWNSGQEGRLDMRADDYPAQVPQSIDGVNQFVRTMLNNCRAGEYRFRYEGTGTMGFHGGARASTRNGESIITFSGDCGHAWFEITHSLASDPVRNVTLVPLEYVNAAQVPLFDPDFIRGLREFHSLRFMDWQGTNNSRQSRWDDRPLPGDRSYGISGMPIEHAIMLSNMLDADPWFCIPHRADDDYIRSFARLVRDSLQSNLKVYVEYSNEIWNWIFSQSHFVGQNAMEGRDGVVDFAGHDTLRNNLRAVGQRFCNDPEAYCHPEKNAYMMDRTFRIWRAEFGNADTSRLVRVAAVQHSWYDNTRRVLSYLFEHGSGADAVSPAGYFSFNENQHLAFNAMDSARVTPDMILDSVNADFVNSTMHWTRQTARYARQYGLQFLVYEGGQHMQPHNQGEWGYNHAVWNAQIHPRMYDLYMRNFELHSEDSVDCKLFVAFSYVGPRQSRWGSWGHLENYGQSALTGDALRRAAPKFAALLDANSPRRELITPLRSSIPWKGAYSSKLWPTFDLLGRPKPQIK